MKERADIHYVAFVDESYTNASRFRSIACCSLAHKHAERLSADISEIVANHGLREFKWSKLRNNQSQGCAEALLALIIDKLASCAMRIDVLTWDVEDRRHKVVGRDDNANFERMFFHLLSASMQRRGAESTWRISADQRDGVDWATIHDCLAAVGLRPPADRSIFDTDRDVLHTLDIQTFETVESDKCPLVQLADLFAGIAVFSGASYDDYKYWLRNTARQTDMSSDAPSSELSNGQRARFEVLKRLDERCKARKLGVSLATHRRLRAFDGSNSLNFWLYEPQHEADRAPVRENAKNRGSRC